MNDKPIITQASHGTVEILDLAEAAAYLGVRPAWLKQRIYRREVTFLKLGHLIRFRRVDLDALLDSCLVPAGQLLHAPE